MSRNPLRKSPCANPVEPGIHTGRWNGANLVLHNFIIFERELNGMSVIKLVIQVRVLSLPSGSDGPARGNPVAINFARAYNSSSELNALIGYLFGRSSPGVESRRAAIAARGVRSTLTPGHAYTLLGP